MSALIVVHKMTVGDTDTVLRYAVKKRNAAGQIVPEDFTGYTAVTIAGRLVDGAAITPIVGSFVDPRTDGILEGDHVALAAAAGNYELQIAPVNAAGKIRRTDSFLVEVARKAETAAG